MVLHFKENVCPICETAHRFLEAVEPALGSDDFLRHCDLTRLMYGEQKVLSGLMKEDLLQCRYSYFEDDLVILNGDNALMVEPSGSMEIADILEFANAQLLELRYYDDVVDRELASVHGVISAKGALSIWNGARRGRRSVRHCRDRDLTPTPGLPGD